MSALAFIAEELLAEGFVAKFERDGSLSLSLEFEPLEFTVTNELSTLGLFTVAVYAGLDGDTNAHNYEDDFACPTALGTLKLIQKAARQFIASGL